MSRTDNTDPYWTRAVWWQPEHWQCQHAMFPRGRTCDLPDEPQVIADYRSRARARLLRRCIWIPSWHDRIAYGMGTAPSWYNTIYFTGPERRRVRDQLTRARQEHRATGQVDVETETAQHRHQGNWAWW